MRITGYLFTFLILLICRQARSAQHTDEDYVLVVHSINFNETWTHQTYETIQTLITQEGLQVKGEELQIPIIKDTTEILNKLAHLREEYPLPPRAVVCIGDPAWLVIRPLFDNEWKGVPSLVCYSRGMVPRNIKDMVERKLDPQEAMVPTSTIIKGYNAITLSQPLYIRETIEMMQKMQPELKKVVFVNDNRYISILTRQEVQSVLEQQFPDLQLDVLSWPQLSTEHLLDTLTTYSNQDAGIIYYSWYAASQKGENHYLIDNVQKMTNSFSNPPVYVINDLDIEGGNFAGGHYISVEDFNKTVITYLQEMLKGKKIDNTHEHMAGTPRTYLNYQHLYRHGISPSRYPQNAVYFEQPPTFLEKYKVQIICGIVILILLMSVAFLRIRLLIQKRKTEEEQREKEKIEEANRLKTAFLANMSHEIRTPLNAIVGFSTLLACGDADLSRQEIMEFTSLIEKNSQLLMVLISDILDLSKIESNTMEFHFEKVSLNGILESIYSAQKMNLRKGVELLLDLPDRAAVIYTDPTRLGQVVNNLINNAVKFTAEGRITIGYRLKDFATLEVFVEDTGTGMSEEVLAHIFERFYKGDAFVQGTGLGLAICRTIVERFHGKIEVASSLGKGSRFAIVLPQEMRE